MLIVLLSAVVSISVAVFAISIIRHEFEGRWSQIAAALAFDERTFVGGDLTPVVSRRQSRPTPARVRLHSTRRAAA